MKNLLSAVFIVSLLLMACSKKETPGFAAEQEVKMQYDTVAVDSFSAGATSVDIVRKIRMSSQNYQDSIKQAVKLQKEEQKLKEELEKENKKKLEDEKKKTDTEKKQKTSEASSAVGTKTE
jgi:hydroxylamine reductase (hybrid-cluster protein)